LLTTSVLLGALLSNQERKLRGKVSARDEITQLDPRFSHSSETSPKNIHSPPPGTNNSVPLDNYYSRPHMKVHWLLKPVLFVGGSDGSGTRALVDLLARLGVPMLVDDDRGLDVHAGTLFNGAGWPPLVVAALSAMHTANYEYKSLPGSVKEITKTQVKNFSNHINARARALLQTIHDKGNQTTSNVRFGLKAPVSMLLLPILLQAFGRIKFIHVVRDGRDVSFSINQSPMTKYYDSYYKDYKKRRQVYDNDDFRQVMGMQLWADWNKQVLDWEQVHNDGHLFDYMVVRSEDLLNPQIRFESLLQLADFVGSPMSERDICCISSAVPVDMGHSVSDVQAANESKNEANDTRRTRQDTILFEWNKSPVKTNDTTVRRQRDESLDPTIQYLDTVGNKPNTKARNSSRGSDIIQRYGKWSQYLNDRPELLRMFHSQGGATLKAFGYEPKADFLDRSVVPTTICDERVVCQ
jgi:hypothetical protein